MAKLTKRQKAIAGKIRSRQGLQLCRRCCPADRAVGLSSSASPVDVAVNLGVDPRKSDQVVRSATVLPHGTGKTVRVAVFTPRSSS